MKISNAKIAFLLGLLFFIFGLFTLPHYGINWDTINHLPRGQAYLHYFLTGKKDYSDIPLFKRYFQNPDKLLPATNSGSRSYYQNDAVTFSFFLQYDGDGHPPLSDILSSVFNRVLFGKLHIINDIDSYRVYGVFLASVTVGIVYFWISKIYGRAAGLVSSIFLATYPLFWSESHFNTEKDIPETAYWTLFLFCVYSAVTKKKLKWFLLSGLFFGLAFGTKFNILFSSLVIIPWLIFCFLRTRLKKEDVLQLIPKLLLIGIIGGLIFIGTWPYLWQDLPSGLGQVFGFYKTIGTTSSQGYNTYPLEWILFTTPPLVLVFDFFGLIFILKNFRQERHGFLLLLLLWLLVPILRVTLPSTSIYGGIRQIMEYIPAIAIIGGIGFSHLIKKMKFKVNTISVAVILISAFLLVPLVKLHPNENVYFNFLVGGIRGAKERNIKSWGNSFGAAYRQGVSWIDGVAPKDSEVVLTYELLPNIPEIWFRDDIAYHNSWRSGYLQNGEYALTLIYQGVEGRSYYDNYLENFVRPVYEVKADGVSILKVWKNSPEYVRKDLNEKELIGGSFSKDESSVTFDLKKQVKLSRLEVKYLDKNCKPLSYGLVQVSSDRKIWHDLPGTFPEDWRISFVGAQPSNGNFIEPFVGQMASAIRIVLAPHNTCLFNVERFKIFYFDY